MYFYLLMKSVQNNFSTWILVVFTYTSATWLLSFNKKFKTLFFLRIANENKYQKNNYILQKKKISNKLVNIYQISKIYLVQKSKIFLDTIVRLDV